MTELGDAPGEQEPAGHNDRDARRTSQEREEAILGLLKTEIGQRGADRQEESRYRQSTLRWTRATFLVTFITMAAVIYYAAVAARQHRTMIDQASEARKANQIAEQAQLRTVETVAAENRAWLGIKEVNLDTTAGQPIKITASLVNSGRTPATGARMNGRCDYGPHVSPKKPLAPGPWIPVSPTMPNQELKMPCVTGKPLSAEDLSALQSGGLHVVFSGAVEYTDRFGSAGRTRFCFYSNAEIKGTSECPVGNGAE